jgi:hypothetical protein
MKKKNVKVNRPIKIRNALFATLGLIVLMLAWIMIMDKIFNTCPSFQDHIVDYVLAPFSETLFYIYLPMKLARIIKAKYKVDFEIPIMLFVAFQFILLHEFNYPLYGRYWACVIQGFLYGSCYLVYKENWKNYGYFWAVLLHSGYNLGIHLLNL